MAKITYFTGSAFDILSEGRGQAQGGAVFFASTQLPIKQLAKSARG
jgi:hypothetical protein